MPTPKQLAANRANAAKSTGPRTEAGKQRSSLNATRHGLTGQVVLLPEEDLQAFNQFTLAIIATLAPADPLERQLAQSFASYQWRINRAAAIEDNLFTLGLIEDPGFHIDHSQAHNAACNAKTFRDRSDEFSRLSLYASRLVRQAERILHQLKTLQAARQSRESSEMEEAIAVYKTHKKQGLIFDPKSVGFVLTIPQIEAQIHRKNLANPAYVLQMACRAGAKAA